MTLECTHQEQPSHFCVTFYVIPCLKTALVHTDTVAKIHIEKSHILKFSISTKIYILKISFLTKYSEVSIFTKVTFYKYHFPQKSHFANVIFDQIHIHRTLFFTKFIFF